MRTAACIRCWIRYPTPMGSSGPATPKLCISLTPQPSRSQPVHLAEQTSKISISQPRRQASTRSIGHVSLAPAVFFGRGPGSRVLSPHIRRIAVRSITTFCTFSREFSQTVGLQSPILIRRRADRTGIHRFAIARSDKRWQHSRLNLHRPLVKNSQHSVGRSMCLRKNFVAQVKFTTTKTLQVHWTATQMIAFNEN